ncbi:MAG: response regulator [Planctomycetota bacterium]
MESFAHRSQILIVDDEVELARAAKEFLFTRGYDVKVALKGSNALRLLKVHSFDLLLLDINIPDVSGLHIIRAIKQMEDDARKVIVVSGNTSEGIIDRCEKEGVFKYLFKPVDPLQMLDEVRRALGMPSP